ncbi:hypothetical protein HPB50_024337 [Hyalomma asiaticum]|uniref:Uncharacterized protein n=1 Tax=Hyalomma asiaticum TaxID=266040 RepID=A0ACB7TC18_HYAAI|nr:hypothetical protein HPB50_024337 [Hyalomma asiaticum]
MCGVDDVPEHVVNQHLQESGESHGLLRFLHTVYEQADLSDTALKASIQSAFPAHKEDLEADILNTALFDEDPLRFLLDIVLENSSPKRLRILELVDHDSESLLVAWLAKYLFEFSLLPNAEYTVAHPSPERLSGKVPQDIAVVASGSASSRKKLSEADLIVHRRSTWTSSGTNLADEVSAVCRDNSFVLLAQRTALTPC